jgi:L-seryl-tRNA(Ser) seleniumtransferase
VADCKSEIGSGALPLATLLSAGLAIRPRERKGAGTRLEALAAACRDLPVPVIGHVKGGALILDLRCLDDEAGFLAQLSQLPTHLEKGAPHVPAVSVEEEAP